MRSRALLLSEEMDMRTPDWFLDLVREVGPIKLDPSTNPQNTTKAEAFISPDVDPSFPNGGEWRGRDGLSVPWTRDGLAFINPRYGGYLSGEVDPDYTHTKRCPDCKGSGEISTFAECRICERCKDGRIVTGRGRGWAARIAEDPGEWIALVPTRTDAKWWHTLHAAATWGIFWRSPEHGARINFVDPVTGKVKKGSTLASSVFYHGPNPVRFVRVFEPHGLPFPGLRETLRLMRAAATLTNN